MGDAVEDDGLNWTRRTITKERIETRFYVSPETAAKKIETLRAKHVPKKKDDAKKLPKSEVENLAVRMSIEAVKHHAAKIESIISKDQKAFKAKMIGAKDPISKAAREAVDQRLGVEHVKNREAKLSKLRALDEKKFKAECNGFDRHGKAKVPRPLSAAQREALSLRLCPPAVVAQAARENLREKYLALYDQRHPSATGGARPRSAGSPGRGDGVDHSALSPDEMDALASRLSAGVSASEKAADAARATQVALDELKEKAAGTMEKSRRSLAASKRRE